MADDQGGLVIDKLFKGLTRPPTVFGVSYSFMMLNLFSMLAAFMLTTNMWIFPLMGVFHLIGYLICREEPLFLELIILKMRKFSGCSNKGFHGGNSYDFN